MLVNEEYESRENQKKLPVNILLVGTIWDVVVPYFYENIQQDKAKTHPCYKAAAASVMHPVGLFCLIL